MGTRVAEIMSNEPGSYAWSVLYERTPALIGQVRDALPYEPDQRRALAELLDETRSGKMRPLDAGAPDHAAWQEWGAPYFGRPWEDAPFLWWESYFYRRLLQAVRFFEPGPWFRVDLFEPFKSAELTDASLETERAQTEQAQAKLLAALWGNQADLGFLIAHDGPPGRAATGLVADDSAHLWSALAERPPGKINVVADNAGRELLADLVLIDHFLEAGLATQVVLHVKPNPYYVSDAITADVVACLRLLKPNPAQRLSKAMADGRLILYTHDFYCAPLSYHHMPPDLKEHFGTAAITLMKGDLNYRRLVGDFHWPPSTPFAEVAGYFPGPVVALRTLKSDVATGIDPATVAALDAAGEAWRTTGTHALIQALL